MKHILGECFVFLAHCYIDFMCLFVMKSAIMSNVCLFPEDFLPLVKFMHTVTLSSLIYKVLYSVNLCDHDTDKGRDQQHGIVMR